MDKKLLKYDGLMEIYQHGSTDVNVYLVSSKIREHFYLTYIMITESLRFRDFLEDFMAHLLVRQLRFACAEFLRGLEGVEDEEARKRFASMNSISWIIGHLAAQEYYLWVQRGLGEDPDPGLYEIAGYGKPARTPPLKEMWASWHTITSKADVFLDKRTPGHLETYLTWQGKSESENVATLLLRCIYHYWFHLGEAYAIRQLLGHVDLPTFVGWVPKVTVAGFYD